MKTQKYFLELTRKRFVRAQRIPVVHLPEISFGSKISQPRGWVRIGVPAAPAERQQPAPDRFRPLVFLAKPVSRLLLLALLALLAVNA